MHRWSWHPEEVLALTRWSTVDGPQLSLPAARRLHLMRLFCCLVLVRATTTHGSPVDSVTPLVESAVDLGPFEELSAVLADETCSGRSARYMNFSS
jgi:hypothetical protein